MEQEILITDVTRMGGNRVCIAGVDRQANTVRPDLGPGGVREQHLYNEQGVVIRPRAVVSMDLAPVNQPTPPHTEDCLWIAPEETRLLRLADDPIWRLALSRTAHDTVEAMFGAPLHEQKRVAPGTGTRSLGTIKPAAIDSVFLKDDLYAEGKRGYRLAFRDSSGQTFWNLSITDLSFRYYVDHQHTHKELSLPKISAQLQWWLQKAETWLRLGLTRPWQPDDEDTAWCYLQVTGIYTFPDYLRGACFADFAPA